jgi:hypothetical protein
MDGIADERGERAGLDCSHIQFSQLGKLGIEGSQRRFNPDNDIFGKIFRQIKGKVYFC